MQCSPVRRLVIVTILSLCLLMMPAASASPLKPKVSTPPKTYGEAMFGIDEVRNNVAGVDCGGWDPNSNAAANNGRVTGNVPIPTITGVPGRTNGNIVALSKAETGIAERGAFAYPKDAYGFVSDCDVKKEWYQDDDLRAGKWERDIKIDEQGKVTVIPGTGHVDINPWHWCRLDFPDFATPKYCKMLYDAWIEIAKVAPRPPAYPGALSDMFCPVPPIPGVWDPAPLDKTYCFDFTWTCHGDSCRTINPGNQCHTEKLPDNVQTKFTECIPHYDADGNLVGIDVTYGGHAPDAASPSSFYRHYIGSFTQVPPPPPADATVSAAGKIWKFRSECYGYYREDDPKVCVTDNTYDQCEITIATPDEQKPDTPEWPDQNPGKQKGETTGTFTASSRPPRTVPDPWVADSASSLTLIDTKKLEQNQKGFDDPQDILPILGTPLSVRQVAGKETTVDHGQTDMFDDTDHRAVSGFWEAQQKELLKMMQDPQTKLIMPSRFLLGLSEDDPIFQYVSGTVSRPDGSVELTLRAGSEDLGNVLLSLERAYVAPVQEVRIPLIVPLASAGEIDALIAGWQEWKLRDQKRVEDEAAKGIAGSPFHGAEADALIAKLEQYKLASEKVRRLRSALAKYLGKLLGPEQQIRGYVADWYRQNANILRQTAQRSQQRRQLKDLWRNVQQAMLVTDECQLIWCSNQRYTLPVYSLLDQWWGSRNLAAGAERNQQYKPDDLRDLHYYPPKDQEYDFSDMKFPRDPLLIPVLWPVQAKLNLPIPPLVGAKPPSADEYPDLPWIPDATVFDNFPIPTVTLPAKETLTASALPDLTQALQILQQFRDIVGGGEQDAAYDRGSMQGVYCRFPRSVTIPPDLDKGNADRIVHVENDLKERVARLFSRWMPNRQEDFAGKAARLQKEFPAPAKPACREDMLCVKLLPEEWSLVRWQWLSPIGTFDFTTIANELETGAGSSPPHGGTLPTSDDPPPKLDNPYAATILQLSRVFDGLPLPITINLLVPPPKP